MKVTNYIAGNIGNCLSNWEKITQDRYLLDIIRHGLKLNFTVNPPSCTPFEPGRSINNQTILNGEVKKLLAKGVIATTIAEPNDYFSHLFLRPKKDGNFRTILNLKGLNKDCQTNHFKMESISNVISLISKNMYMASIDIRDAFYSVPIYEPHRKYLKFLNNGIPFQFEVMPNGYVDAMRIFTKLLKPAFSSLREQGRLSVIYVDDSFLGGRDFDECVENVQATRKLLENLGFFIHPDKSIFTPTQKITFLGYVIDSVEMSLTLTEEKKSGILHSGTELLEGSPSIRTVASFIGKLTASFEALPMGRFHYRHLERSKILALNVNKWDFDKPCPLSSKAITDIIWWMNNLHLTHRYLTVYSIDLTLHTDASMEGWGATDGNSTINGRWLEEEKTLHINVLELKAILLALLSFLPISQAKHVSVMTDNTTAISYINKRGGIHSEECNSVAFDIWNLCNHNNCFITATHIPGVHNVIADTASRKFADAMEWKLDIYIFQELCKQWGTPEVDLFASYLNKQLSHYYSFQPDPESAHINAFTIRWDHNLAYAFPPFSAPVIWRLLKKIVSDQAVVVVVLPLWTTQTWFPKVLQMMIGEPVTFSSGHLSLPGTLQYHPLFPKLRLFGVKLSGREQPRRVSLQLRCGSWNKLGE